MAKMPCFPTPTNVVGVNAKHRAPRKGNRDAEGAAPQLQGEG